MSDKFSQEQYDLLKQCSDKKDMTEWNEWREKNPNEDVLLESANLRGCYLKNAYLNWGQNKDKKEGLVDFRGQVHLENSCLRDAHLEGAYLKGAHLEGAEIVDTYLQDTYLEMAIFDGSTLIFGCKISPKTNFSCVGLDVTRLDPWMKPLLEYNIKRINWNYWYENHPRLKWLVKPFWWISDYGRSTNRIVLSFFLLAIVFAIIYYVWGYVDYYFIGTKVYPGIISDLFVLENNQETISRCLVPFRAIYFSIVTMTTLGFGDMYANAHSFIRGIFGHTILAIQVILGYVLLGALVTRFAVLFSANSPSATFYREPKKR